MDPFTPIKFRTEFGEHSPVRIGTANDLPLAIQTDNYFIRWYSFPTPRVFRTRTFARWMRKAGLIDNDLREAVSEMIAGLIDADLGGHVVKKRVALPGQGKRGGSRTIVATNMMDRWFFIYGFGKNEQANIDKDELRAMREMAMELLALDSRQLAVAISAGEIVEVGNDHDKAQESNSE